MAAGAATGNASVTHRCTILEAGRALMTSFARSSRCNVSAWLGFDIGKTTTVTSHTTTTDTSMIHHSRNESCRAFMASLAGCCSWYMCARLTFCRRSIVATGTTRGNSGMVHRCAPETHSRSMASLTPCCSSNMRCRFSNCSSAIVATITTAGNIGVIKFRTQECAGLLMASFTAGACWNVVRRFPLCFCSIMATCTIACNACMVKFNRPKKRFSRAMTAFTCSTGLNMTGRFTPGFHAVMT